MRDHARPPRGLAVASHDSRLQSDCSCRVPRVHRHVVTRYIAHGTRVFSRTSTANREDVKQPRRSRGFSVNPLYSIYYLCTLKSCLVHQRRSTHVDESRCKSLEHRAPITVTLHARAFLAVIGIEIVYVTRSASLGEHVAD